jgi:hypothetical protein
MQSGGRSSTGALLTNFFTFLLLSVLSYLQFASSYRKSIRKKWCKNTVKTSTMRRSPLTAKQSMIAETEKHMDIEIGALFSLTL